MSNEVPKSMPALPVGATVNPSREGFAEWKTRVDAIALEEGLTPKEVLLPGDLDVWVRQFNAGKTPAQAWRAVPYRRR